MNIGSRTRQPLRTGLLSASLAFLTTCSVTPNLPQGPALYPELAYITEQPLVAAEHYLDALAQRIDFFEQPVREQLALPDVAAPRSLHEILAETYEPLPLPKTRYDRIINEVADGYQHVDPLLAKILAMKESGGNPHAVSRKGARGIFQIMPIAHEDATCLQKGATANYLRRTYGIDPTTLQGNIHDPTLNAKVGLGYLDQLLDRFDNDTIPALISYNATPTLAEKYIRGEITFTDLPRETRDFIGRIISTAYHLEGPTYLARFSPKP